MTQSLSWSSLDGAHLLDGDVPLPKIWQRLHDNATQWVIMSGVAGQTKNLAALDEIDRGLLKRLTEADAANWQQLCVGAGATQMGAVSLSWCGGASLTDVWSLWSASGVALGPTPQFRRPAQLLNPDLIGENTRLSDILNVSKSDTFAACIRCARAGSDLLFDVPDEQVQLVPPDVARFLVDAVECDLMVSEQADFFFEYWSQSFNVSLASSPRVVGEIQ